MRKRQWARIFYCWLLVSVLLATLPPVMAQDDSQPPVSSTVPAEDLQAMMRAANGAYTRSDLLQAAELYEQILATGLQDATVYFNLGITYFELGQLPHARLNFYRAQALNPRDVAIAINLDRVARTITVGIDEQPALLHTSLARFSMAWLTLPELIYGAFIVWCLWCVAVLAQLLSLKTRQWLLAFIVILTGLTIGALTLMVSRVHVAYNEPLAIVMDSTQVYSGPGPDFVNMYSLSAASEVYVLQTEGEWVKLMQQNGRRGWVPIDAIEIVMRPA